MKILFFVEGIWKYLSIFVGCIEVNKTDIQHKIGWEKSNMSFCFVLVFCEFDLWLTEVK